MTKSKSKKSLLISILVLVMTVAVAGASTFAWFTINEQVTVENVNVQVTTGSQGLYISANAAGPFKTSLTLAELKAATAGGNTVDGIKANNITSADGLTMKTIDGTAAATDTYMQFTLFFRATGAVAPQVQLSNGASVTVDPAAEVKPLELLNEFGVINPADYGRDTTIGTIALGAPIRTRGAYASRVSLAAADYDGGAAKTQVWDPYYGDNVSFAGLVNNGRYDNSLGNLALDYYNKTNNPDGSGSNVVFPAGGIAPTLTKAELDDVLSLKASLANANYHEGKVVVRIWLEGFDGDCLNSVLNDKFIVNLAFNVVKPVTP